MYGSGVAEEDNKNCKFTFSPEGTKDKEIEFKLLMDYEPNNYYLILEYNKNYMTLYDFGNYCLDKQVPTLIQDINHSLRDTFETLVRLQTNYKFVHGDLHSENIMVVVDKDNKYQGVKLFDFDLSHTDKIVRLNYYHWSDLDIDTQINKEYLILLDMWRLWVSLKLQYNKIHNYTGDRNIVYHTQGKISYVANYYSVGKSDTQQLEFGNLKFSLNNFYEYYENNIENYTSLIDGVKKPNNFLEICKNFNKELMSFRLIKKLHTLLSVK